MWINDTSKIKDLTTLTAYLKKRNLRPRGQKKKGNPRQEKRVEGKTNTFAMFCRDRMTMQKTNFHVRHSNIKFFYQWREWIVINQMKPSNIKMMQIKGTKMFFFSGLTNRVFTLARLLNNRFLCFIKYRFVNVLRSDAYNNENTEQNFKLFKNL